MAVGEALSWNLQSTGIDAGRSLSLSLSRNVPLMQIEDGTVIKARSLAERSFIATSFSLLNFYLQTPCNFAATLLFLHESKTQIENTLKRDYNLVFPDFLTSHFPISCWGIWDFSARYPQARYIYIFRIQTGVWTLSGPHQPGHQQRHRSAQLHCCDSARSDPNWSEKNGGVWELNKLFLQQFVYYQYPVITVHI